MFAGFAWESQDFTRHITCSVQLSSCSFNLYAHVSDAGHNLTLHVMSDSDMKRVAFLQELFSYPEMILKVAHTLSSHYAFAVEKLAVESVGLLLATRVDGLVYDERDALKGVTVVDAQSKPHGVVAVLGQGATSYDRTSTLSHPDTKV